MGFECAVCMTRFDQTAEISNPPCGHAFHKPCLEQWIAQNSTCPTCQRRSPPQELRRIYLSFVDDRDALEPLSRPEAELRAAELQEKLQAKKKRRDIIKALHEEAGRSVTKTENKYNQAVLRVQLAQAPAAVPQDPPPPVENSASYYAIVAVMSKVKSMLRNPQFQIFICFIGICGIARFIAAM